ncbi:MAG: cobalt-precorrin 5A hydrolase [Ruminococcus sp.]|nr:cobalt-precorrin 5A hydrolase [Ruminococcus sp.]
MRAAVISLTENGRKLSARLTETAAFLEAERFCFHSHCDKNSHTFDDLGDLVADIFQKYDALVFICACGIAVRSTAPHLNSKTTDPAVIVIDDCGKFVIPLLSGHIGGANALAERIAEVLGAQAAITTATDTGGRFSPDSFAAANGLIITDMNASKAIACAVLDGEKIGFISDCGYDNIPPELCTNTDCRTGIYVGCNDKMPFPVTLKLVPKNIVLGIGCKRATNCETIERAVKSALDSAGIAFERVICAATIDLKADEAGLLGFCEKYGLKLHVFTAQMLMEADGDFTSSDFVKSITGVDNVCERSAVKCSGGRLIMRKTAADGVTVAAAEKPMTLDFERKVL